MVKRKERSLEELYKLHKRIAKPRLTPILEGICRIQGPVDELDSETENDLEDNEGGKLLIGSSAKKINCMNVGKDSANDYNTKNLFMIDLVERENTKVSMKERSHEYKAMGDSVGTSLEFDHKAEKVESVCIIEEKGVVSKVVDASQSYHGEKSIKEEAEDDCEKCSTSEELQTILQGCSTLCESVQDDNGSEIDNLRDTGPHKTLGKKDTDMPSNTLASIRDQRDQTESKSIELSRETFCMSPDLAPSANFATQLDSTEHKERLSEISTKDECCNAQFDKMNLVFSDYKTPKEVFDVTDGFTKLPEDVVDNNHGCLKEVSSVNIKMGNSCRIEISSDVRDEVNPLYMQETLSLQDNNMPIRISGNLNTEITSAYANAVMTTKESEQHYGYQQGQGSTFPSSEQPVISGPQENIVSLSSHVSEAQSTKHSGCQLKGNTFPSSGQPVISATQENVVFLSSHLSDTQSAKHPQDGCVRANYVPGSLTMEDVQPLEEPSKAINVLPVDVTQDFLGASEQPSPMLIDESLSTEDAENKMHLYENSNIDGVDVETSKMKVASVASDPLSEDNDLELDDVKVCDICGDAGLEDKLAICSMCNDGAEHIYCMQVMLDKVPEGNWLCECCKSSQNAALKKVEKTLNVMSRSTTLSTKKQSCNDSFHSRPFGKTDKKRSDLELKQMKATLSSQSSMKRRAEDLEVGPSTKKQAIEVRDVQHISSSNLKHVPSRENSFKSTDTGKTGQSVSGASLGNYMSANIGKSSSAIVSQSPRHGGVQLLKSRFTSVNSLASDSSQFSAPSSNVASDRVVLSSKSAEIRPSPSLSSRLSNNPKLIAITKNKKDLGSGGFNKVINDSLSSKSKGSITVSNNIETRAMSVQIATQAKEIKIVKLRKDGMDSMTKKSVVKAGNTTSDLMSSGGVSFPLCSKPAVNDTSVNQGPIKLGSLVKDICKSKLSVPEQNSIIGPSPMEENNTKEECSSTIVSGVSVPTFTFPINVSNTGTMEIKSEPLATPGGLGCSDSQTPSQQCNSELTSGQNLMQIEGTFCDSTDSKGCNGANDKPVNISLQDSQNSKIDEKSKNFSFSWTRNILASIASTRCYKCKELGHTAQFCTNRSSASTGPTSLRVSTLKHSAAKMSREMAQSSSGKCNNPLETIVPGDMNACENDQASEQRLLFSDKQEQEGHTEYNFHRHVSDDSVFPSSIEPSSCRKPDGESSVSGEFPLVNSDLGRNFSTITPDLLPLGLCKDSEVYCSSMTTSLDKELPSTTSTKINTKWNNNAQIYPSQKLYVDGEAFISPKDHCKVAPMTSVAQCTVYPIESTVTAVRRNTSSDLPVISNGNYPGTCTRVLPHVNFPCSENLKISAFPEHNFLWQGGFVVRSKGNPNNYYDGLQAHASTCAALKVLDAAKKFSSLILFEEVPRLSTWPMQFQYCSPTDENIALYFFAKDRQSYEGDYRSLLKHMRKNDFALRANFDGVELLIFPSTQLPDKSQCWNKLLYLWGVFRERKANCIVSHAFSQDMIHEQLSTSMSTVGKLNSKVATRVLPSLPLVGFPLDRVDMDIDMEGSQECLSIERALNGLERTKSQISPFSPLSSTQDEGRSKGSDINMMDFDEQKLSGIQINDELLGKDKPSLKNDSSKYSSESGLYSKAPYLNKEKKNTLDTSDGKIVDSQTFGQSIISQISSWRERAHSACPGYVSFVQEKKKPLDTSDGNIDDPQTFRLSQVSLGKERALSTCPIYLSSCPSAVSLCSLERHDNPHDSSKVSLFSSHAPGQQTHTEKERSKSKEDEDDRGRERGKELEYSSFRGKDSGHKEWKLRDRENERDKERNGEIAAERDRRNLSRRHEEYSSHESLMRRDSKEERRHHFSHSPTRHGSRLHSLPMRMNNYDQHHSRVRSPDYDQNRHSQPSLGVEVCGSSRRKDTVSPKGRSFTDFLVDDKGQRKLKKSYSDIYVREIYREQDFSGRNTGNRSSSEMSICSQTQHVRDLPTSFQSSRSSSLEHIHHDSKEYNLSLPKDFQVTERFCFPEPRNTQINDKTTKAFEQLSVKTMSKQNCLDLSDDQCMPLVGDVREPPDLNVPDLELALGAKISSPKEGVLPSFVPLLDKTSIQQQTPSPRMNEVGSSLSLSLMFPLTQKEQASKPVLKEKEVMPDNGNVDTSLFLFGSSVDS